MKLFSLKSFLFVLALLYWTFGVAQANSMTNSVTQSSGPGVSGGGYAFEKTSILHLQKAKEKLIQKIKNIKPEIIEGIFKGNGSKNFSVSELIRIIETVILSPETIKPKPNSKIQNDLLKMDFIDEPSKRNIVALLPFFIRFECNKNSYLDSPKEFFY